MYQLFGLPLSHCTLNLKKLKLVKKDIFSLNFTKSLLHYYYFQFSFNFIRSSVLFKMNKTKINLKYF
jgi:hypothetical protein